MLKILFVLAVCSVCQNMVGEWAWPEEAGETNLPPTNNKILGHVVLRLRNIVHPTIEEPSTPSFPHFMLKACVLGKFCSGKTTCLAKIAEGTLHAIQTEMHVYTHTYKHKVTPLSYICFICWKNRCEVRFYG